MEHQDLPEATTASELDDMLHELDGTRDGPVSVGIKNITVLKRDREGASGGEDAVKVAQGDKNWKDIQKLMAKVIISIDVQINKNPLNQTLTH